MKTLALLLAVFLAAVPSARADELSDARIEIILLKNRLAVRETEIAELQQRLANGSAAYQQLYANYTAALARLSGAPAPAAYAPTYSPMSHAERNRRNEQSLRDSQMIQQTTILNDMALELSRSGR